MSESEAETRIRRIDPRLEAAGWQVLPPGRMPKTREHAATSEYPTSNDPADYALVTGTEPPVGVVEAKKVTVAPAAVLAQAERYSKGIKGAVTYRGMYGVPFLYSTNGEIVRIHDVRRTQNLSRVLFGFHTPTALQEMLQRDLDTELKGGFPRRDSPRK